MHISLAYVGRLVAVLLATTALLSEAWRATAQTTPAPPGTVESGNVPVEIEHPPPLDRGRVTFSIGSDITTAYFFRGILAERDGFIWQSYGTLNFILFEGEDRDVVDNVIFSLGTFNSVHSNKTLADGSGPSNWYESAYIIGPLFGFADHFSGSLLYIVYASPSGAFLASQELDVGLSFDDSEFLGAFALQPSMVWGFELDKTAFGATEGIYLQLGVKPSTVVFENAAYPVTLALPLTLGLSVSNYYEEPEPNGSNDTFGFFDAGLVASVPLAFLPEDYGAWSVSLSVDVLALSGTLADFNRGDGTQWVGKTGFSMSY